MIEVGLVKDNFYRWADGAQASGIIFRYIQESQIDKFKVLVTSGKIYNNKPHVFWLDENCRYLENAFYTPRAANIYRSNKIINPIVGPKPFDGDNLGVYGNCNTEIPHIKIHDINSLSKCRVVLTDIIDECFEFTCKEWGIIINPEEELEKVLKEVKRNNRSYIEALRKAGIMTGGGETLAGSIRKTMPTPSINVKEQAISVTPPRRNVVVAAPPKMTLIEKHVVTEYKIPKVAEVTTPDWFKKKDPVEVSVIVPMWNSAEVIADLVNSWDFSGISHEIIFVSDACPKNSHQAVVTSFANRQPTPPIGKIIALSNQSGFSTACNFGSELARGKYVVFLNADTSVTPGWINGLINPLKNDLKIGIVGNLQVKSDGTIDSAGSEWVWQTRCFEHIGRNIWNGKRLPHRIKVEEAPEEMLKDSERQMVTGCCVALEKTFFDAIGGFDIKYRIGYWEDADLCMKVWENGKKVYFTSNSRIYHKGSHSNSGGHPYLKDNAKLFYSKWVNNGKINKLLNL